MKKASFIRLLQWLGLSALAVVVIFITGLLFKEPPAHALPEFADRTAEACGTCHVNPGGGGPRTMRGILWSAQGRPDQVPGLGDILLAPDVTEGADLYDVACASCHGLSGEGLFGSALIGSGLQESKVRSTILRGRERSGMPAYEGQLTEEQLSSLVEFVSGIASGQIEPPPLTFPLSEVTFGCTFLPGPDRCGGN